MTSAAGSGRWPQHHGHGHRTASVRALVWVLGLTAVAAAIEVVGGAWTGSLALLADAGHMLSDVLSVGLALVALVLARRPATARRSFGYHRGEILAAFVNGLTLVLVSVWIFVEAARRLGDPPRVLGGWMLVVALVGLAVNLAAASVLVRAGGESLNVRAALRHVVADLLGSLGVIVAALVILVAGWETVDPVVSVLVGALVLWSAWGILRESTSILMEGTPVGTDAAAIEQAIVDVPGVSSVHDLHVWTITSGFDALSAHILVGRAEDCHVRRREIERVLQREFGIGHTTLQVEHEADDLLQIRRS